MASKTPTSRDNPGDLRELKARTSYKVQVWEMAGSETSGKQSKLQTFGGSSEGEDRNLKEAFIPARKPLR